MESMRNGVIVVVRWLPSKVDDGAEVGRVGEMPNF